MQEVEGVMSEDMEEREHAVRRKYKERRGNKLRKIKGTEGVDISESHDRRTCIESAFVRCNKV